MPEDKGTSYDGPDESIDDTESLARLLSVVKQSRDKFRTVFDALQDIVVVIDRDLTIQSANLAASKWLGRPIREVIGKDCKVINPICRAERGGSEICPALYTFENKSPMQMELQLEAPGGDKRWFHLISLPILEADSHVEQVALILRDIHDVKEKEEAILGLNKELAKKNQELQRLIKDLKDTQAQLIQTEKMASIGQLAAGVAHEINNPISFVLSNTRTLKGYFSDIVELLERYKGLKRAVIEGKHVDLKELVVSIQNYEEEIDLEFLLQDIEALLDQSLDGLERVRKIVEDLKTFSHVDQAEIKEIDINQALESTLHVVWNELKYKAEVITEFSDDLPMVLGYPQKLNQVFMNLLVNAAQAIEGRGEIRVITRKVDSPRLGVEVVVKDTGCGMTEEVQSRIFDAFFTTKPVGKGTGLGLNMAYKIVSLHKGEIRVESEEGRGTTMTVFIPLLTKEELMENKENSKGVDVNTVQNWIENKVEGR